MKIIKKILEHLNHKVTQEEEQRMYDEMRDHLGLYRLVAQVGVILSLLFFITEKVGYVTSLSEEEVFTIQTFASPMFSYGLMIVSIGLFLITTYRIKTRIKIKTSTDVFYEKVGIVLFVLILCETVLLYFL